jgi:hypothetical protein
MIALLLPLLCFAVLLPLLCCAAFAVLCCAAASALLCSFLCSAAASVLLCWVLGFRRGALASELASRRADLRSLLRARTVEEERSKRREEWNEILGIKIRLSPP